MINGCDNQKDGDPISRRICIAVTGASGAIYAERLIEQIWAQVDRIYLIASPTGKQVASFELNQGPRCEGFSLAAALNSNKMSEDQAAVIRICRDDDLFAPAASGSAAPDQMVIIPCSMGTLGRIANGVSSSLIERAADVVLKQKKPLIVCPRETPFNRIHLRNMMHLDETGAYIVPLMPAFYQFPRTIMDIIDFCVGRVIEALDLKHSLYDPWNKKEI